MHLKKRSHQSEQLDDLNLSGHHLQHALLSLQRINGLLGTHRQLYHAILDMINDHHHFKTNFNIKKRVHIVDLGCGGGDCLFYLYKKLKNYPFQFSFLGIDGNPSSISYAQQKNPCPDLIQFQTANIITSNFRLPDCDLMISSHFVYHFTDRELSDFLKKLSPKTVKHIIFSELYRSAKAYHIFKIASVFFPISNMARQDGLLAIQRAFTIQELNDVIKNSDVHKYKVTKKPFFRMIAQIQVSDERNFK